MADFARFLPLSNRPKGNEDAVTSDRRMAIADVIDEASLMISGAEEAEAERLSVQFVRETRITDVGEAVHGADDLAGLAAAIRRGRRRPVKVLARAVRAQIVLAAELRVPPRVDSTTLGVVALYAATSAPLERRAVIKGHTLRATDAGWEFGRGPILEATALEIVRFLLGLSDTAPRKAARPPADPGDQVAGLS